jgi:shikimate dehydrogenase
MPASSAGHTLLRHDVRRRADAIHAVGRRSSGAGRVLDGLGMLVEQAAVAFSIWNDYTPDTLPVITMLRERLVSGV